MFRASASSFKTSGEHLFVSRLAKQITTLLASAPATQINMEEAPATLRRRALIKTYKSESNPGDLPRLKGIKWQLKSTTHRRDDDETKSTSVQQRKALEESDSKFEDCKLLQNYSTIEVQIQTPKLGKRYDDMGDYTIHSICLSVSSKNKKINLDFTFLCTPV